MEVATNYQTSEVKARKGFILDYLCRNGTSSRADLAKASGLRSSTVTRLVRELIDDGYVLEEGFLFGNKNRRAIGVRVNSQRFCTIGAVLSHNHCTIALRGLAGGVYEMCEHPLPQDEKPGQTLQLLKRELGRMLYDASQTRRVLAVGIAVPGVYYQSEDILVHGQRPDDWKGIRLAGLLREALDVPVVVNNDADAGAYAQHIHLGGKNLAYLHVGQGIGCGIVVNGRLVLSEAGGYGEIGHTTVEEGGRPCRCGKDGCLESYSALWAVKKAILEKLELAGAAVRGEEYGIKQLAGALKVGDPIVCQEYDKACRALAVSICNLLMLLPTQQIVLGGELVQAAPERLLACVQSMVDTKLCPMAQKNVSVLANTMEEDPSLMGACALAAKHAVFTL